MQLLHKQAEFLRAQEDVVVYRSGIRGGKTCVLTLWALIQAMQGRRVALVEPTRAMCKRNLLTWLNKHHATYALTHRDYTTNLTDLTLSYSSTGGSISLFSAEAIDTIRGAEYDDAGIDEYTMLSSDEVYLVLLGRLSGSEDAKIRLVSSPTQVQWAQELEAHPGVRVITQTTLENAFLPRKYLISLARQYGIGSKFWRREILGEYVSLEDGIFDAGKLSIIPMTPPAPGSRCVRAWDTATSAKSSADFTASCLLSVDGQGRYTIHDVTRWQGAYSSLQPRIVETMRQDPPGTVQLVENTQGGQVIMSVLRQLPELAAVPIVPQAATADKITRALPASALMATGSMSMCSGPWNKVFTQELDSFGPKCPHDDQVDALAYAFTHLAKPPARLIF